MILDLSHIKLSEKEHYFKIMKQEIRYKAIMVREETHKRFVKSVEYGKTHDQKLNELLNETTAHTTRRNK